MKTELYKALIASFYLFFATQTISAQSSTPAPPSPKSFKERIYFGGNMGLQFGTITAIDISPLVGYRISNKLSAGLGTTYLYYRDNRFNFKTNIYGGRIFGRYDIFPFLFAYSEYELLNVEAIDPLLFIKTRINVESILVGGGYVQRISDKASFSIMLLWNVNPSIYSPYANPIIRAGFNIGI